VQKPIIVTIATFTIFPDFLTAVTTIDPPALTEFVFDAPVLANAPAEPYIATKDKMLDYIVTASSPLIDSFRPHLYCGGPHDPRFVINPT
jgi:hypothetical protein